MNKKINGDLTTHVCMHVCVCAMECLYTCVCICMCVKYIQVPQNPVDSIKHSCIGFKGTCVHQTSMLETEPMFSGRAVSSSMISHIPRISTG